MQSSQPAIWAPTDWAVARNVGAMFLAREAWSEAAGLSAIACEIGTMPSTVIIARSAPTG